MVARILRKVSDFLLLCFSYCACQDVYHRWGGLPSVANLPLHVAFSYTATLTTCVLFPFHVIWDAVSATRLWGVSLISDSSVYF